MQNYNHKHLGFSKMWKCSLADEVWFFACSFCMFFFFLLLALFPAYSNIIPIKDSSKTILYCGLFFLRILSFSNIQLVWLVLVQMWFRLAELIAWFISFSHLISYYMKEMWLLLCTQQIYGTVLQSYHLWIVEKEKEWSSVCLLIMTKTTQRRV